MSETADDKKRIKHLEALTKKQAGRIERLSKTRYQIPKAPKRVRGAASHTRIAIPDTHGCFVDQAALAALVGDLTSMSDSIKEIVLLGDHLDCGAFLAQHHTIGYVAEAEYTFEDDVDAANHLLDRVQAACPRAVIHYLEGNHERRIEKFCVTSALQQKATASYLTKMFSTESVLHLAKRGIHYYKQGRFYDGLRIPATIKLGRCYFTHGNRTGTHAASAMLRDFGGNVVYGHTHRTDMASGRTVKDGEMGAWSPGCLCRQQPLWMHTQVTNWSHGYGLQLVREDGDFLHINVPIIDGKSYMMQLTAKMGR